MQKVSDTPDFVQGKILIVCGPTAVGKTKLAVSLARKCNGELVNADSRQMYEGMDILSGKDIPAGAHATLHEHISIKGEEFPLVTYDIEGIPLWLYDVSPLAKPLSVSHFQSLATHVISNIQKRGKLPIVVGGTGFYLSSLVRFVPTLHVPQNQILRDELQSKHVLDLQNILSVADPVRWQKMNESDRNNPRRLIRAIEVTRWNREHVIEPPRKPEVDACWIGLRLEMDVLSLRIAQRVADRFAGGAVDEVRVLGTVSEHLPGGSMLGLSILQKYINGFISKEEAKRLWVTEEVQYAKRQMVWFARQPEIHWFDAASGSLLISLEKLVYEWYT